MSKPRFIFDAEHKRALTISDMERARIGERLWLAELSKIPPTAKHYAKLHGYIKNIETHFDMGTGIVLGGPHGSGKSGAAVIVAKEVLQRGCSALFMEEAALVGAVIENTMFDDTFTMKERAMDVALLVVDDLGLSAQTENNHIIENIVKHRVHRRLVTIITTNLIKDEYLKRYMTLASAMREAAIPIYCSGVDWREGIR